MSDSKSQRLILLSRDAGLLQHWHRAFAEQYPVAAHDAHAIDWPRQPDKCIVWIDLDMSGMPAFATDWWNIALNTHHATLVATSSNPDDTEAAAALDMGCAGYCHAYSDVETLRQIQQVVMAGNVWIGRQLMQRLMRGTQRAAARSGSAPSSPANIWSHGLTQREQEVAGMAANGASNADIAESCGITERTVKAHLGAVFTKLEVADRLQLALRVHGIQ